MPFNNIKQLYLKKLQEIDPEFSLIRECDEGYQIFWVFESPLFCVEIDPINPPSQCETTRFLYRRNLPRHYIFKNWHSFELLLEKLREEMDAIENV